jgi:hypothetical protein
MGGKIKIGKYFEEVEIAPVKRQEVETMHRLLDVHFGEDFCRIEDETFGKP